MYYRADEIKKHEMGFSYGTYAGGNLVLDSDGVT